MRVADGGRNDFVVESKLRYNEVSTYSFFCTYTCNPNKTCLYSVGWFTLSDIFN